jgi:hypothetical protein
VLARKERERGGSQAQNPYNANNGQPETSAWTKTGAFIGLDRTVIPKSMLWFEQIDALSQST